MTKPNGRPRLYDDPIFFEERVEQYFDDCQKNDTPPTLADISYFLGFEDKESFSNYANYDGFSRTVKRARLRIEGIRSQALVKKETFTPGQIFDLKANFGWRENGDATNDTADEIAQAMLRAVRQADKDTKTAQAKDDPEVV